MKIIPRSPDLRSLLRGVVAATAIGLASAFMATIASAQEPSEALLIADFDARPQSTSEKRIIQIAIAMEGEYSSAGSPQNESSRVYEI